MLLGDKQVSVEEFPEPGAGPGEIVVRVRESAVCGTDLHFYRLKKGEAGSGGYMTLPEVVPGHECCGEVEEVGPGVTMFRPGDRVVAHHLVGCGLCRFCRRGAPHHCSRRRVMGRHFNGSFGQFVVVPERNLQLLPEKLSFMDGAFMSCSFGTAFSAVRRAGVSGADTVAVFGLGPVGLCVATVAAGMGARVVGVDVVPERLELGKKAGATETVDGSLTDPVAEVRELTGGLGADVTVDTSGVDAAQNQALDAARPLGTMVFLGVGDAATIQPMVQLIQKDLTAFGSHHYKLGEWEEMCDYVIRTRPDFGLLAAREYTVDEADEALRVADEGRQGKVLFSWD